MLADSIFTNHTILRDAMLHAQQQSPEESCGIIVNNKYIPKQNIHEDPVNHFRIVPTAYAIQMRDKTLQGIVHSHPVKNSRPSCDDLQKQISSAVPWLITFGNNHVWFGDQVPIPELMGRKFVYGVTDCFTLVRDWYRINKDFTIKFIPTEYEWWYTEKNYYMENFAENGFSIVDDEYQIGDVLIGSIKSVHPCHAALYIGNNTIIHHLPNRVSVKESLGYWRNSLNIHLRFKEA